MVDGCGASTTKCLVFFFNLLAFLAGASLLIGCGVAYASNPVQKYLSHLNSVVEDFSKYDEFKYALIVGMVLGGIIVVLGFLGCCGALVESACMLGTFATIMFLLIVVQFIAGALILGYRNQLKTGLDKALNDTATTARMGNNTVECEVFRELLKDANCCGVDGTDLGGMCQLGCHKNATDGCSNVLWNELSTLSKAGGIVLLSFIGLEIAALVFSCVLCAAVRKGSNLYEKFA